MIMTVLLYRVRQKILLPMKKTRGATKPLLRQKPSAIKSPVTKLPYDKSLLLRLLQQKEKVCHRATN